MYVQYLELTATKIVTKNRFQEYCSLITWLIALLSDTTVQVWWKLHEWIRKWKCQKIDHACLYPDTLAF